MSRLARLRCESPPASLRRGPWGQGSTLANMPAGKAGAFHPGVGTGTRETWKTLHKYNNMTLHDTALHYIELPVIMAHYAINIHLTLQITLP